MQARKATFFAITVAATLMVMTSIASAGTFSNVFVYGDSLSDTGNIYAATGGTIPLSPPYYNGRFSNGILADEYLANALHAPLTNFAWGSATTGHRRVGRRWYTDDAGILWNSGNVAAGSRFAGGRGAIRSNLVVHRVGRPR